MEDLIRAYLEAYNTKNVPAMLALVDEQIVFENVSNVSGVIRTTTRQAFEDLANQSLAYFSERQQTIRFLVISAESAAVEIDYRATLAIDLPNGLKAGDTMALRGVSIFEQKNGKLTRISDYS
ncbi:nuclear transport factor 2 family protein [Larkinella bovis]|uniref:Nuclear transport factor 2 family protein n=1 Tax=Larkinella bovis TaxID=683041 RepID=A0ABW0ICL0_9BACT